MPEATTIRLRDDTPCMEPAVTLEAFAEQTNAVAVRIEPGGDARELLAHLDRLARVDIAFPAFTDGRGYSATQVEFQITRWLSLLSSISTIGRQSANVRISRDY